jgi:YggT family protein
MVLDAVGAVQRFIVVFTTVYAFTLILYVLTSWVQLPYSLRPVQRFLYDVCEPYLRFWRKRLPLAVGPIDLSPMIAIIALGVLAELLVWILNRI